MMRKSKKRGVSFVILMMILAISGTGMMAAGTALDSNHTPYDSVLKDSVKDGFVNYANLKKNTHPLDQYLDHLSRVKRDEFKSWQENERLAYLINLYNAATLKLIVDHYPVESIKDIGGFFRGPWSQKFIKLFGDTVTLGTLEHEILRKDYDEPRIHVALVCAAKGCPPLREEAYTAAGLNAQLDDQSKTFLESPKGMRIDRSNKKVYLSSIFNWFGKDFINKYTPTSGFDGFNKTEQAVLNFCGRYVSEEDREYLQAGNYSIQYLDYDWSLNEKKS